MVAEVVIARGRLRNAWRALVLTPVVAWVVGLLGGLAVVLTDSSGFGEAVVAVFWLAAAFAGMGVIASILAMAVWLISPARVRYVRDGDTFMAMRGRRVVRKFNLSEIDSVTLGGGTTTREMFIGLGAFPGIWLQLPQVWWTRTAANGAPVSRALPVILVVGKSETDELAQRLTHELEGICFERTL